MKTKDWVVFYNEKPIQIVPRNDIKPHWFNINCECNPVLIKNGKIMRHNSFDGREILEFENISKKEN